MIPERWILSKIKTALGTSGGVTYSFCTKGWLIGLFIVVMNFVALDCVPGAAVGVEGGYLSSMFLVVQ